MAIICYSTSYPFGFPPIRKRPVLYILKFPVNKFINQYKKVLFIWLDEYIPLARSSECMRTFHNMNIVVPKTGIDEYSLNWKCEISNETLANITRYLLINSRHKKEFCLLYYHYVICLSRQTNNRLCGDFPHLLWNRSIPDYKHIKIWGVRV